jgi:hypothetical protein
LDCVVREERLLEGETDLNHSNEENREDHGELDHGHTLLTRRIAPKSHHSQSPT